MLCVVGARVHPMSIFVKTQTKIEPRFLLKKTPRAYKMINFNMLMILISLFLNLYHGNYGIIVLVLFAIILGRLI